MELITERTKALGMKGRVVISHAFCLGMPDQAYVDQLIEGLAEAGIAIMTNGPSGRACPAVKRVRAAGVAICSGSDGIRDTWGPYGSADMLERAMLIGMRNNFRRDDELAVAFDIVTHGGAQVMGLEGYGLEPGCKADLVLLDNQTVTEAIVSHGPRALVMKNGETVARNGEALVKA